MRKAVIACLTILILSMSFFGCQQDKTADTSQSTPKTTAVAAPADTLPEPSTLVERFSYSLGYLMTQSYMSQGVEIDHRYFAQAMSDLADGTSKFTEEEMNNILMEYQTILMAKQQEMSEEIANENLSKAESFLATNREREGVTETESGLQYEVLTLGTGPMPVAADTVTVHYSGSLLNGQIFDSSYERGEPATFPLDAVIPGWTEGVQLMPVGSTFRFFIPPALGYAEFGAGDMIGPQELLIFEVELLAIGE